MKELSKGKYSLTKSEGQEALLYFYFWLNSGVLHVLFFTE